MLFDNSCAGAKHSKGNNIHYLAIITMMCIFTVCSITYNFILQVQINLLRCNSYKISLIIMASKSVTIIIYISLHLRIRVDTGSKLLTQMTPDPLDIWPLTRKTTWMWPGLLTFILIYSCLSPTGYPVINQVRLA